MRLRTPYHERFMCFDSWMEVAVTHESMQSRGVVTSGHKLHHRPTPTPVGDGRGPTESAPHNFGSPALCVLLARTRGGLSRSWGDGDGNGMTSRAEAGWENVDGVGAAAGRNGG